MAQYYKGGEEKRKFEDLEHERNDRFSDSDYGRESHQKPQGDSSRENVADETKEGLSRANAGTRVEKGRGYSSRENAADEAKEGLSRANAGTKVAEGRGQPSARPTKGSAYNGDEKFSSQTDSNGFGDEGGIPGKVRESGENGDRKPSGYDRCSGGESGHQASEESFAKGESGRKRIEGLTEVSPYTQHDSTDDYNKRGYGGDGYTKNVDSDVSGGSDGTVTEGATIAGAEVRQPQQYDGIRTGQRKEDVKETLVPGHKTEADQIEEPDSPKRMEGCMGKLKEKLTSKPRDTDSTNYDQECVGDENEAAHKKKGVIGKIKEKLSPST